MPFYQFFNYLGNSLGLHDFNEYLYAPLYLPKITLSSSTSLAKLLRQFRRRFGCSIAIFKHNVQGAENSQLLERLYFFLVSSFVNDIFMIGYYGCSTPCGFIIVNFDVSINSPWADWLIFSDFAKRVPIRMTHYRERYFFNLTNLTGTELLSLTELRWLKYLVWYSFYFLNRVSLVKVSLNYFQFPTFFRLPRLRAFTMLDFISVLWANAGVGDQFAFFKRPILESYTHQRDMIYVFQPSGQGYREINSLGAYSSQLKLISAGNIYWEYHRMYRGWQYDKPLVYVQNFAVNYSSWVSRNTSNFYSFRDKLRNQGFRKHEIEQLRLFAEFNHEDDAARQWDEKLDYLRKVLRGEITIYTSFADSLPSATYEELTDQPVGDWAFGKRRETPTFDIPINLIPVWFPLTEYSRVSGYNPETRIFLRRSLGRNLDQRIWRLNDRSLAYEHIERRVRQLDDLNLLHNFVLFHSF